MSGEIRNGNRKSRKTPLYLEILKLISEGLSNKEIAQKLGTTPKYVSKVRNKYKDKISPEYISKEEIEKEIQKLRQKEIEKYYKKFKEFKIREENIISALSNVIPKFPIPNKEIFNQSGNNFEILKSKRNSISTKTTAVLLLSDWHIGEYVSPEETFNYGVFNSEIAAARVELILEKTINILLNHEYIDVEKLIVVALGDMVSGTIHEELETTQDLNAAEQLYYSAYLLAFLLNDLSKYFPKIEFYGVIGNHGRLKKKKYYKEKYVNYDYIVYQIASLLLRDNKNIEFNIPKSPHIIVKIYNHNFLFTHGDNIRSWAGIPWYGIHRYANNMREIFNFQNIILNGVAMGHFHQPAFLDRINGPIIVNGSLKGVDEYSLSYGLASRPSQTLFGVTNKYPLTFKYILWLDERLKPKRYKPFVPDIWGDFSF